MKITSWNSEALGSWIFFLFKMEFNELICAK